MNRLSHRAASHLVARFNHDTPTSACLFKHASLWWDQQSRRLQYVDDRPCKGHTISVSFCPVEGHPEWMRVHSTNWRCEDEPNGIYTRAECRAFWRRLVEAGFESY
ncbi:hypothetical protein [Paraburkholderia sp. MM6662-R1]|uniref:hypothetical protein n=1 Tax=Paraburkholderia sp. MM6662-R1 TaxID=2991066 RepID=UPI003D210B72